MISGLPSFVGPLFLTTTFLTAGFLVYSVRKGPAESVFGKILLFAIFFWLVLQTVLGIGGFYLTPESIPPRVIAFAAVPAMLFALAAALGTPIGSIEKLPFGALTLLHIVRIPVELVLYELYAAGSLPRSMTFEGSNFDIISGLTAPVIFLMAFRSGQVNRKLLFAWNIGALILLVNVVTNAILSFPGPLQRINFDQPNKAIMFFPYILLPAFIVPSVLFAHAVVLRRLLSSTRS